MNLLRKLFGSRSASEATAPTSHVPSPAEPEAFVWLNKQGVRSSHGYEVQCVDRFREEYREGGKVITVPVERGSFGGGASVSIERTAFERWNGSQVVNSGGEQARILRNFKAAMAFQGVAVEP